MFTLSPDLQYTSTIRVLIGELIISSNAGATLPVALIVLFIVPRSARFLRIISSFGICLSILK